MAKGKKGKIKIGLRRRKDTEDVTKEQDKTEEDEVSSCSTEPQETITVFLKAEEVQELLTIVQTKDLVSAAIRRTPCILEVLASFISVSE